VQRHSTYTWLVAMLRLGAAAAVGAGVSLAAVNCAQRLRAKKTAKAQEHSKSVQAGDGSPGLDVLKLLERDSASDWGSPVLQEHRDASKTMSPSKLPRPRKLFSDREGQCTEVCKKPPRAVVELGCNRGGSRNCEVVVVSSIFTS